MTQISRTGASFGGAGIPLAVLQFAASRLNRQVEVTSTEDADTVSVAVGDVRGSIHDGCFVSLEHPGADLELALLEGVQALHSYYLGGAPAPAAAFAAVRKLLTNDATVRIRALDGSLEITSYPVGASWLTRLMSPRSRYPSA